MRLFAPVSVVLLVVLAAQLAACGQSIRGELPTVETGSSGLLTAEEAKAAAEALIRARDERNVAESSSR